LQQKG